MRKSFREAERLILSLGFTIIERGRGKHTYWVLRTPNGKTFKQPIPSNTSETCFWNNWKSQLRRHLNDDAYTVNPRSPQSARVR